MKPCPYFLGVLGWALSCVSFSPAAELTMQAAKQLFAREVLPVLQEKCFACHGNDADDLRGELDLTSRQSMLRGGESGEPALVPGASSESPLLLVVRRDDANWSAMPPKENDRLLPAQITAIERWIDADAPWPSDEELANLAAQSSAWSTDDGITVTTRGGLTPEWTNRRYDPANLWAYRPLNKPKIPELEATEPTPDLSSVAIDHLINQRLHALGLEAATRADRSTLIRRATFDLIGLPPTPEEVAEFLADRSDDQTAFRRVIDRLLASPHYGEQWGRHWLDVVRYADSSGFANDYERGNAWRYRDYVVRSLNEDKPYDQFIREQIAGDEIDPDDPELLVATGFLRMGPWELTGMEVPKVARQRFLDDVTDTVGQVFLAHMLQCARCHDHKFDPIPTQDYYALQAAFSTTQLAERSASFLDEENCAGFEERKFVVARKKHYEAILRDLDARNLEAAEAWFREQKIDPAPYHQAIQTLTATQGNAPKFDQIRNYLRNKAQTPESQIPPKHVGFTPTEYGLERVARKGIERLSWRLDRYEPIALSVYSGQTPTLSAVYAPQRMPEQPTSQGELETTCILVGGDPFSPSTPVDPGVLSVVRLSKADAANIPDAVAGRRLAVANWIAEPSHPLTARVMVNRLWQWHFGRAIAGNPNNFGATGKKPSHPELLDWLAVTFIEHGWSIKQMHRLIMTSEAYCRSSHYVEIDQLREQDPDQNSYAVFLPRRLDAEELRDSMLFVSGELNPALGGIPVCPEMNLEAALQPRMVMGTFAEAWQPSPTPQQRHRRSIYALHLRGQRDPFFEVFNAPAPDLCCEARDASTVTPQVFAMFNSEISYDRALAFAKRVATDGASSEEQVAALFQFAYQRRATPEETRLALAHWQSMTERHERLKFAEPSYPTEVTRIAVEENTGEKFEFSEPLEAYREFVRDLKPIDASPSLRGLAELCLVLLNSNEFVYVY